jgi:hypothetical protein
VPEDPEKPNVFQSLLSQAGFSSDLVQKVRFKGPVGKIALIGIFCVVGLGGIGIRTGSATVAAACVISSAIVALAIVAGILWYSDKHPDQATMEGMEVIAYHQQKAWASKGWTGYPPSGPLIPPPGSAPPQINPPMDADK